MNAHSYVISFGDEAASRHDLVGGKATSLGRLAGADFPVPPGFSISTAAYTAFMTGLNHQVSAILVAADYEHAEHLDEQTALIRKLIVGTAMPEAIANAVTAAYGTLGGNSEPAPVAVRSSGTAEDLAEASFAGLHDTFLDVQGDDDVLTAVQRCWASLWTARAVHYRHDNGFAHENALLAVVV